MPRLNWYFLIVLLLFQYKLCLERHIFQLFAWTLCKVDVLQCKYTTLHCKSVIGISKCWQFTRHILHEQEQAIWTNTESHVLCNESWPQYAQKLDLPQETCLLLPSSLKDCLDGASLLEQCSQINLYTSSSFSVNHLIGSGLFAVVWLPIP